MITVMTLDAQNGAATAPACPRTHLAPFARKGIDLLCCQSFATPLDGRDTACHLLSDALGMTCSSFAADRTHPAQSKQTTLSRGLAIFSGPGVWVLNSGSFMAGEAGEETIVQFALTRKFGVSVLALNLHLAASASARIRHLRGLFAHPLLREPYGAVVLCADRPARLPGKEWQAIIGRSSYSPLCSLPAVDGAGWLCLLTLRTKPLWTVAIDPGEPSPAADSAPAPGVALAFDLRRITTNKPFRPAFPLSFREQWMGYREHRAFA